MPGERCSWLTMARSAPFTLSGLRWQRAHLTYGLRTITHAAELLDDLRGGAAEDVELVDGRDGRDVAAHLDASVRSARAAYALLHCVFEKETPA